MTSTFTAWAIAALFSEVNICLRANSPISPCQYVNKALTSAQEKYGFSLVHTQRCTANPHAAIKMAMRSRVMCAVIGQCVKQSLYARTRLESWLVCNVIRTAILDRAMGPQKLCGWTRVVFACPLNPHFAHSVTHCVE